MASAKTPLRPLEPSITMPVPLDSSACITRPSASSYTLVSVKPNASFRRLIAAFASVYRIVGYTLITYSRRSRHRASM